MEDIKISEVFCQLDKVSTDLQEHLRPKMVIPVLEKLHFEVENFLVRSITREFYLLRRTGYIKYSEAGLRPYLAVVLLNRKDTILDVEISDNEVMLAVLSKIHLLTSAKKFKRFIKLLQAIKAGELPLAVIYSLDKKITVKQWGIE